MHDLAAYLRRIGLSGTPSPAEVHRAHATSIPFESLDPYLGVPVSLAQDDLERKLVHERRGGYCFEQNLLLKSALEALGADVEMFLARVRMGDDPRRVRPRTHLVLRVWHGGTTSLADVGFGFGTLLDPIPFATGGEHVQSGWRYRLIEGEGELVLEVRLDGHWETMYGFAPEPVPFVDLETGNWFTSTHPRSPFVRGPMVSSNHHDGRRVMLNGNEEVGLTLVEQTAQARESREVTIAELPELLARRFGIAGFGLDDDGRLVRTGGPGADPEAVAAVTHRLRRGESVPDEELGPAIVDAILTEPFVGGALQALERWLDGTVEHEAALPLAASWARPAADLDLESVGEDVRLYIDAYPLEARVLGNLPDSTATWLVARLAQSVTPAERLPAVRGAVDALAGLAAPRYPSSAASLRAIAASVGNEDLWYQLALGIVQSEIAAGTGTRS